MPFYFRKSVSAGPFRFNFSKSGIGVSVGVKGLRIGTGPKGHYVQAGRGGLYYRTTLGRAGQHRNSIGRSVPSPHQPRRNWVDNVEMVEVDSGDVLEMRDENLAGVLDEINTKQSQFSMATIFGCTVFGLGVLMILAGLAAGAVVTVLALPAWGIGKWLDSYKRTSVLFYDLTPEAHSAYEEVTRAFDRLVACHGKWHVTAGGAVQDLTTWKRNAGATHLVSKNPTALTYALPNVLRCNITPPALRVGRQTIYFLPDAAFIVAGSGVGAVSYGDLRLTWQDSNFIETGAVPRDAQVISHVWKHPNKNGGPDRRFANNHQIPVCRYEALLLSSASGVNELLEFSCTGVSSPFATALNRLYQASGASNAPRLTVSG